MKPPNPNAQEILQDHLRLVGTIVGLWGLLDTHLDITIWEVAGVPHATGACMTSQIIATQVKIRVLKSLLGLMEADAKLVARLNRFGQKTQPLLDARNRAVHDPWLVGVETGTVFQRRAAIISNKMEFKQIAIEKYELEETIEKIKANNLTFYKLEDDIMDALKARPAGWRQSLPGLLVHRLNPPE